MTETKPAKTKSLGLWMCTALVVGNMVGTGVFLLPASLAPMGWNAIIALVLTILGGLGLAYVFGSLARRFSKAGGPYVYTAEAFGPAAGFMVAWSYWISLWVGNVGIATGTLSYVTYFIPEINSVTGLSAGITFTMIWTLILINIRGTFLAGSFQLVTTILKFLPLIFVAAIGIYVFGSGSSVASNPLIMSDLKLPVITAAATLTVWGILGIEAATVPAGNIKDPEKTIPRATMLGMSITGVIYLLVFASILLLMPADQLANSNAPFAEFIGQYMGNRMDSVIAVFAVISGFGALNGWIMLMGEMPNAMAKSGVFPKYLAKRSKYDTPARGLIVSGILLSAVLLMNYQETMLDLFKFIILLSTTSSLYMFLSSALAALKLQKDNRLGAPKIISFIAIMTALYAVWTVIGAGYDGTLWSGKPIFWGLVLLVAGLPVYLFTRRREPED